MHENKKWKGKGYEENWSYPYNEVMAFQASIVENFAEWFSAFEAKYFLEENLCVEKVKSTKFQNCHLNHLGVTWMSNLKQDRNYHELQDT